MEKFGKVTFEPKRFFRFIRALRRTFEGLSSPGDRRNRMTIEQVLIAELIEHQLDPIIRSSVRSLGLMHLAPSNFRASGMDQFLSTVEEHLDQTLEGVTLHDWDFYQLWTMFHGLCLHNFWISPIAKLGLAHLQGEGMGLFAYTFSSIIDEVIGEPDGDGNYTFFDDSRYFISENEKLIYTNSLREFRDLVGRPGSRNSRLAMDPGLIERFQGEVVQLRHSFSVLRRFQRARLMRGSDIEVEESVSQAD